MTMSPRGLTLGPSASQPFTYRVQPTIILGQVLGSERCQGLDSEFILPDFGQQFCHLETALPRPHHGTCRHGHHALTGDGDGSSGCLIARVQWTVVLDGDCVPERCWDRR